MPKKRMLHDGDKRKLTSATMNQLEIEIQRFCILESSTNISPLKR